MSREKLIYIASPHSHHYKLAKLCLEHGHPVICEKPFTANRAQAEELFALAAQKNLFITEAMWTRYLPYIDKVREILASGAIGEICSASATFGCPLSHVERMARPELAGGALLGAIFMATDYSTSPMTVRGGVIFGVGIGAITMCIRLWGAYPEGMSFAILIMNAVVPLINKYVKPKRFGVK